MGIATNDSTSHHPQHSAVPPYLLISMAASDGEWEAPHGMRDFIANYSATTFDPQGSEAARRTRIATSARQTLLLDQALRNERTTNWLPGLGAMLDGSGKLHRRISDAQGGEITPGKLVRTEAQTPTNDLDANRAYDGLGIVYEFLADLFKRSSLDGAGMGLLGTIHHGQHYDNAFWDGAQLVMGDGDGEIFNSFTSSLSVVAHELGHGLLQYTTNLDYHGQSGALNESIADVFGVLVEQFAAKEDVAQASWLIGKGLFTPMVNGIALRSMAAPGTAYDDPVLGRDPQPKHMNDYVHTTEDSGGVHLNSGIPNHAFYLFAMALGGKAWERAGSVWFNTIATRSLPVDASFALFAGQTLLEARRSFGENSPETGALGASWAKVGIDPHITNE